MASAVIASMGLTGLIIRAEAVIKGEPSKVVLVLLYGIALALGAFGIKTAKRSAI